MPSADAEDTPQARSRGSRENPAKPLGKKRGEASYFFMSFGSGCMAAVDVVLAVDEPLSEQAERVTTAMETMQTSMRYFMASHYARGMPNVKWEE